MNPESGVSTTTTRRPQRFKANLEMRGIRGHINFEEFGAQKSGEAIRALVTNDKLKPGYYNILWNCKDNRR
jgi:hypothetical protein